MKKELFELIRKSDECEVVSVKNRIKDCLNPMRYADQEAIYSDEYSLITIRVNNRVVIDVD